MRIVVVFLEVGFYCFLRGCFFVVFIILVCEVGEESFWLLFEVEFFLCCFLYIYCGFWIIVVFVFNVRCLSLCGIINFDYFFGSENFMNEFN